MNDNNFEQFFKNTVGCCNDIIDRQTEDLGFNPFALMSDLYKRENFHSDILKAILDPNGSHNEGSLYLQLFYKLIIELAEAKNQQNIVNNIKEIYYDRNVEVTRETGRTDIALECKVNKWALIIENKLNNATDQSRQLPKYYDYWTERGDKIIAIIYLTPTKLKEYPNKLDWKEGDVEMISPYFLHMSGYDGNQNCLFNWLKQCELQSKLFNNKAVFEQYSELIKNQAGNDMNKDGYIKLLNSAKSSEIDLESLLEVINQLPVFYTNEIFEKLKAKDNSLNLWIYNKIVVVVDKLKLTINSGDIFYYFDIICNDFKNKCIKFTIRDNKSALSYDQALELVDDFLINKNFELQGGCYFKPIIFSDNKMNNYPSYDELDVIVDNVYSLYKDFIEYLSKKQEK